MGTFCYVAMLFVGIVIGFSACALANGNGKGGEREPVKYRFWKDNSIVKLYETDALNAETLEHFVIFTCRGKVFVRKKELFFGKVTNFQGEQVNRYVRVNQIS